MFEQAFKNIDDVLWKEAGYTTELDYTEQTCWLLFLKYLDALEQDKADEAALEASSAHRPIASNARLSGTCGMARRPPDPKGGNQGNALARPPVARDPPARELPARPVQLRKPPPIDLRPFLHRAPVLSSLL